MANFENSFYEENAIKIDERKLSEKFSVEFTASGSTPDGYSTPESMVITSKDDPRKQFEVLRDGSTGYYSDEGALNADKKESYSMMGVDTDSKEFKEFIETIKKPENFNAQTVEKMLDTVPQLTAEKQIETLNNIAANIEKEYQAFEQEKVNEKISFINSKEIAEISQSLEDRKIENFDNKYVQQKANEVYENESWINSKEEMNDSVLKNINKDLADKGYELIEKKDNSLSKQNENEAVIIERYSHNDNEKDIQTIKDDLKVNDSLAHKIQDAQRNHEATTSELAQPGRTYTGNIVEVDAEITIQKTKTGKLVVHETENLPGIKGNDVGSQIQISYGADGKGDIASKSNDLEIGKEKNHEKHHQADAMER